MNDMRTSCCIDTYVSSSSRINHSANRPLYSRSETGDNNDDEEDDGDNNGV